MGDFLLDLRPKEQRALGAGEFLKFFADMHVARFDFPDFGLLVTSADNPALWAPYATPDGSLLVALCGRIALEQRQWDEAARLPGVGGLAARFIALAFVRGGVSEIEDLSGNFVVLLYSRSQRKLFVVTDRWGLFPAFRSEPPAAAGVYSSHPDAVADAVGESRNWDLTSFAEFILASKISAPFTYYKNIKALPVASTTTISFDALNGSREPTRVYFVPEPRPQTAAKIDELAARFADAFKQAVTRRTLPILGRSAIGLSGGLDSRTVLCSAADRRSLFTFSCYDEQNLEFQVAAEIARRAGVEFVPLKRDSDYYGRNAALGVKISAGMGCIASNHFLGIRDQLRELGAENLLTGCYCDYLFKGLALNRLVNPWTTRESLGPFNFSYYAGHCHADTALGASVRARLETFFPAELRRCDTEANVLAVEHRRMFPLAYEEDNAERTIPQRVMGWYVPIADNGLMDVILSMSPAMKLNRTLFARMVQKVCSPEITRIADSNTGAPINASPAREAFNFHLRTLSRAWRKIRPSNATNGSWLNWNYYATHSPVIQSLWSEPNSDATDVFRQVLGNAFSTEIAAYEGKRVYLFLQLFTLKLWFDQRANQPKAIASPVAEPHRELSNAPRLNALNPQLSTLNA